MSEGKRKSLDFSNYIGWARYQRESWAHKSAWKNHFCNCNQKLHASYLFDKKCHLRTNTQLFYPCLSVCLCCARVYIFFLNSVLLTHPGIFFVLPCIESYQKVDLRTITLDVPPQEVIQRQRRGEREIGNSRVKLST